jgi:hypothetical protein
MSAEEKRVLLAEFDADGVWVYQAFSVGIAQYALKERRFGGEFKLSRMSWIKPSFGWMLYRSSYASLPGQERILKIKINHESFRAILARGVPSSFDSNLFSTFEQWQTAVESSEVRYQWDPDRDLALRRLAHRALQLGLRGHTLARYAHEWILDIADVTAVAHSVQGGLAENNFPGTIQLPHEREYPLDSALRHAIGIASPPYSDSPHSDSAGAQHFRG